MPITVENTAARNARRIGREPQRSGNLQVDPEIYLPSPGMDVGHRRLLQRLLDGQRTVRPGADDIAEYDGAGERLSVAGNANPRRWLAG